MNQVSDEQKPHVNDERKTVELCGDERAGRRCIRARGHNGDHESHTALAIHTWK
jgi:hypothetical protein